MSHIERMAEEQIQQELNALLKQATTAWQEFQAEMEVIRERRHHLVAELYHLSLTESAPDEQQPSQVMEPSDQREVIVACTTAIRETLIQRGLAINDSNDDLDALDNAITSVLQAYLSRFILDEGHQGTEGNE